VAGFRFSFPPHVPPPDPLFFLGPALHSRGVVPASPDKVIWVYPVQYPLYISGIVIREQVVRLVPVPLLDFFL